VVLHLSPCGGIARRTGSDTLVCDLRPENCDGAGPGTHAAGPQASLPQIE